MSSRAEDYGFHADENPRAIAKKGGDAAGEDNLNSLPAISSAVDLGLEHLELDVIDTADYHGLIMHDARSKKAAAKHGVEPTKVIQSMTLQEVKDYLGPRAKHLITAEEVMALFPRVKIYWDLKRRGAAVAIAKAVKAQGAHDRVSIGSYDYKNTKLAAGLLGGQERIATRPGTFETHLLRSSSHLFRRFVRKSKITSIHLADYLIPSWMFEAAEEEGVHLGTWAGPDESKDNREYIERSFSLGVSEVMSIRTKDLADVHKSHHRQS
jgi:glycerophosphoryl diester phosphodiesterase